MIARGSWAATPPRSCGWMPRDPTGAGIRSRDGLEGRLIDVGVVVVTDHVFPHLEAETALLAAAGHGLRFAGNIRTPEEVVAAAADADAILNCYAPIPAEVIRVARPMPHHRAVRDRTRHDRHPGGDGRGDPRHERPGLLHRRGLGSCPRADPVARSARRDPGPERPGGRMGSGPRPSHPSAPWTDARSGGIRPDRPAARREDGADRFPGRGLRSVRARRGDEGRRCGAGGPADRAGHERRRLGARAAHARDPAPDRLGGARDDAGRRVPRQHLTRAIDRPRRPSRIPRHGLPRWRRSRCAGDGAAGPRRRPAPAPRRHRDPACGASTARRPPSNSSGKRPNRSSRRSQARRRSMR